MEDREKLNKIRDLIVREYNKSSLDESQEVLRGYYEKVLREILVVINYE